MIDENKYTQYGEDGLDVQGIIIHNTSSPLSARELFKYLNEECKTSQGTHFFIDHNEVVEVMPLTWRTYTTGKGQDWAFNHCIAIEICSNISDELYLQGEERAVELIKSLMEEYGLSENDIYFHMDFNERYHCPNDILNKYTNKNEFITHYFGRN